MPARLVIQAGIEDRMGELLPTTYFHIVFTLPEELRSLCMGNRKLLFGLLFKAAHHTLLTLSKDEKYMGATPGITSILHTNGQDLSFHPHVHCIVSGGGIGADGKWIKEKRSNGRFLFPRRAMEKIYKGYFLDQIRRYITRKEIFIADEEALENILSVVSGKKWNVYAKAPFGGPAQIIEYLGRYTHTCPALCGKVAITAHRILHIGEEEISFKYKDYQDSHKQKIMTLGHEEFLRRFEQHILPKGFVKIRHAGFLHSKEKMKRIQSVCSQLQHPPPMPKVSVPVAVRLLLQTGKDITICPKCGHGKMILVKTLIFHNGTLVDAGELRNRGSPKIKTKPW